MFNQFNQYNDKNNSETKAAQKHKDDNLYRYVKINNYSMVTELLKNKANVNAINQYETPLHVAIRYDYKDIVKLLLSHNADTSIRDEADFTSVHLCAFYCRFSIAELVLESAPCCINSVAYCAEYKYDQILKVYYGATPLDMAVTKYNKKMIQLLLNHGANYKMLSHYNKFTIEEMYDKNNTNEIDTKKFCNEFDTSYFPRVRDYLSLYVLFDITSIIIVYLV